MTTEGNKHWDYKLQLSQYHEMNCNDNYTGLSTAVNQSSGLKT